MYGVNFVSRLSPGQKLTFSAVRSSRRLAALGGPISRPIVITLILVAMMIRLFRLSHPSSVVFDEVHFGGFAGQYINGTFFMDVHPPLGKLLFAATGYLAGYNGMFNFSKIGADYIAPRVPYVAMRMLPAVMGCLLSPVAYMTSRNLGFTQAAAVLVAIAIMFDNALATQSRLILLDSILILFTAMAMLSWSEFMVVSRSPKIAPFTLRWWLPLIATGINLGLAVSVKMVGLFIIATIGTSTVWQLWTMLGNLSIPPRTLVRHVMARAFALVAVPMMVYALFFAVHFRVLWRNGAGNTFMSPEFQASIAGSGLSGPTYEPVVYGSKLFIRHHGTNGGFLHSHEHAYQTGSLQQQVTCYPFVDSNSYFFIKPALEINNGTSREVPLNDEIRPVRNGDIVRLEHTVTFRRLHSHDMRAPVTDTEDMKEVSAYGSANFPGDSNDHWRLEIVGEPPKTELKAITQRFHLHHVNQGCSLFSHSIKLPEWAFGQQEVACAKNGRKDLISWLIEQNDHSSFNETTPKVQYRQPSFWEKFIEIHKVMFKINNDLKSSHPFDSRPVAWPLLNRGISFWAADEPHRGQIYLLGNPILWWLAVLGIVVYVVYEAACILLTQRGFFFHRFGPVRDIANQTVLLFSAWAFHYLPFFVMSRQLFLHHYLPAFYFSVLLLGTVFHAVTFRWAPKMQWASMTVIAVLLACAFTYGLEQNPGTCNSLKWRSKWDFDSERAAHSL
ncbi:LOW QUALITY PROTEIN: PMT-domain-containing protein [Caulochytrium protostelioides]|uniref:Dolichyl-phosphate-mannose--protein mannosyltransferase n=1 Tax=Caulochytrium protostelioides TaxID=1555241 RepID=A0A4P9X261_9FUNG|nr:LOW QUALITY PROTEIN: PMT-domain-containing protein [Caulochytrium protostelioides]